ncbi:Hypothetical protein (Fragment) [Durusdinium trenchii]|uniref:Uncharacterized protein n=1 Tax=Durusdinium trenchii TaxID=1381693 RepID=A0ABP0P9Y3_9DINO
MVGRHVTLALASLALAWRWWPSFVSSPQLRSSSSTRSTRSARWATLSNPNFFWGEGFEATDLEQAAARLAEGTGSDLWNKATFAPEDPPSHLPEGSKWTPLPKEQRWMSLKEFSEAQGSSGNVTEALFLVLSQGSGYLEKPKVDKALESWQSPDGSLNQMGWASSLFWAKAQIAFGYAWLYGMSSFCGYFFFFRPPLVIFLGIDLLPGVPQWWTS